MAAGLPPRSPRMLSAQPVAADADADAWLSEQAWLDHEQNPLGAVQDPTAKALPPKALDPSAGFAAASAQATPRLNLHLQPSALSQSIGGTHQAGKPKAPERHDGEHSMFESAEAIMEADALLDAVAPPPKALPASGSKGGSVDVAALQQHVELQLRHMSGSLAPATGGAAHADPHMLGHILGLDRSSPFCVPGLVRLSIGGTALG